VPDRSKREVFVFFLDDVPARFVPLICFLWKERIVTLFREEREFFEIMVPCHLTVLSEQSKSKFGEGCADPQLLFHQLKHIRAFSLEAPILLEGPTGTGKTFFAKFLHRMTDKDKSADGSKFERINLAELNEDTNTFISRMVGHLKGSFTGAINDTDGVLRTCKDGTVFFDELDGLKIPGQIRLLTYMDDSEGDGYLHQLRLGESEAKPFKRCNMVFATNRKIDDALREGDLRPDFLYRFRDTVQFCELQRIFEAPGEDRDARIMAYICFFLMKLRPSVAKEPERFWFMPFSQAKWDRDAFQEIRSFHWSGNFRTIEKFCRHLLAMGAFGERSVFDLKKEWALWKEVQYDDTKTDKIESSSPVLAKTPIPQNARRLPLQIRDQYRELLKTSLDLSKDANGKPNQTITAKNLGIGTRTLKKKLKEFGLE
jgi:DNA-binding NtrC family response regulator